MLYEQCQLSNKSSQVSEYSLCDSHFRVSRTVAVMACRFPLYGFSRPIHVLAIIAIIELQLLHSDLLSLIQNSICENISTGDLMKVKWSGISTCNSSNLLENNDQWLIILLLMNFVSYGTEMIIIKYLLNTAAATTAFNRISKASKDSSSISAIATCNPRKAIFMQLFFVMFTLTKAH